MVKNQKGFVHLFLLLIFVIAVIGGSFWLVKSHHQAKNPSQIATSNTAPEDKAVIAGKSLSANKCSGTSKLTFTHLPMNESDFGFLIPYGDVIGGHVTPIDHQYFTPAKYTSARDSYPVYAMADANVVDIQPRTNSRGTEYRLIFAHSCTSLYYYDLVTSLTGPVKAAYEKHGDINVPVKAGDQIGAIGGQTLDFALWDTSKHLTGFINPASYDREAWKVYTTDPFPSYTPQLRTLLTARDPRTAEPIAGKIDHDIDGKLIGTWFQEGTGGYHDMSVNKAQEYWKGHLSVIPNVYDPKVFVISLGDFGDQALQFVTPGNTPDPASVGVDTGLVKYNLSKYQYVKADGSRWDNMAFTKNPKPVAMDANEGCLLVQLTAKRSLKAESFVKKSCSGVTSFTSAAKTYER
jgi:hypothetical protein